MTYDEAVKHLPAGATWSSSFGYRGQAGCTEIWREPDGTRWRLDNGPWHAGAPFKWTCRRIDEPTTEATAAGAQYVIPGAEKRQARAARQLDLLL